MRSPRVGQQFPQFFAPRLNAAQGSWIDPRIAPTIRDFRSLPVIVGPLRDYEVYVKYCTGQIVANLSGVTQQAAMQSAAQWAQQFSGAPEKTQIWVNRMAPNAQTIARWVLYYTPKSGGGYTPSWTATPSQASICGQGGY